MRTPGKTLLLLLVAFSLWAQKVRIEVADNPVLPGERVEITVTAVGERVLFPKIGRIDGYRVREEEPQRLESVVSTGGAKWVKRYAFYPERGVTVPPLTVIVDGETLRTSPLSIRVMRTPVSGQKEFELALLPSRRKVYKNEMVDITVRFKESKSVPVMNVDFLPMRNDHFWIKRVGRKKVYPKNGYLVHDIHYLYFPQRAGKLTVGPAEVRVAVANRERDAFGFIVRRPRWRSVRSDPVTLTVKPLPSGVSLVGRFVLEANLSSESVASGEPVRLSLEVRSEDGNIDDLEAPKVKISGVTVFAEDPVTTCRYTHGRYLCRWRRDYTLIAESSFEIPSIRIRYLDPREGKVKVASSPLFRVWVKEKPSGAAYGRAEENLSTQTVEERKVESVTKAWLFALAAFLAGMGTMYLLLRGAKRGRSGRKRKGRHAAPADETQMLQRLMPHIGASKEAARMAETLHASLYEGKKVKVEKKAFEKLMEKLRIERA